MRQLTVVGVTHRTAPLDVLETFPRAGRLGPALARAADAYGAGAVAVSTCNRFELYLHGPRTVTRADAATVLADLSGQPPLAVGRMSQVLTGHDAVLHLFTVAAGLDSRVVGEGEILGQVRAAADLARAAGTLHPELASLFQRAVAAGRRARKDSGIGQSASVGARAAEAVDSLLPRVAGRTVAVVGAGPIALAALGRLDRLGARTVVCTRRPDAPRPGFGNRPMTGLDRLPELLATADAVVCAAAAPEPVITAAMLRQAAARRGGGPLLLLDLAVPRTVVRDPSARVLDLDDLPPTATGDPAVDAAAAAARTVRAQAEAYRQWCASRGAGPLIEQITRGAGHPPLSGSRAAHQSISEIRRHAVRGDLDAARAAAARLGLPARAVETRTADCA